MLPFLNKKDQKMSAGVIVKQREPDYPEEDKDAPIDACSQALIKAVQAQDVKGVSAALQDAFEILESIPHEEINGEIE